MCFIGVSSGKVLCWQYLGPRGIIIGKQIGRGCNIRRFQNPGIARKGGRSLTRAKDFLVDLMKCTKANPKVIMKRDEDQIFLHDPPSPPPRPPCIKRKTSKKWEKAARLTTSICENLDPFLSFIKRQNNPKYDNLSRNFHIFLTASGEGRGGSTQAVRLTAFSQLFL